MARQPWEDDEVVTQPARGSVVQITPPNRQAPLARPDQARGEANQADLSGYEASTRPSRDAAADTRAAAAERRQQEAQRFTQRRETLNDWQNNPQVRAYNETRTAYAGLRNLQRDPNGVNAVATIFAFMKALDPGSTVREGEQAQAQNSGGVPTAIINAYNQAVSGNGLSEQQRRQMVEAAADQLEARAGAYNDASFRTRETLRGLGIPYRDIATQIPLSLARGARGYELENRLRHAYGLRPLQIPINEGEDSSPLLPADIARIPEMQRGSEERFRMLQRVHRAREGGGGRSYVGSDETPGEEGFLNEFGVNRTQMEEMESEYQRELTRRNAAQEREQFSNDHPLLARADRIVRAGANTITLGFADHLAGLVNGSGSAEEHALSDADWAQHPEDALLGTLLAGARLPIGATPGRQIGANMLYGGVEGFNAADGGLEDRLESGLRGTAVSAGLSAALSPIAARAAREPNLEAVRRGGTEGAELPALVDDATGRLNAPLEDASPAQRVGAAREFGIDLPMDAATDRSGRIISRGFDNVPGSAGVMNDARRAVEGQVSEAAEGLASRYGSARGLEQEGAAAQQGARSWISRARTTVGNAYDAIPITPEVTATTSNTSAALQDLNQRFASNPALADELRNPLLQRYQRALEGDRLSWQDMKDFRSLIGERIGDRRFDEAIGTADLRRLYGALSEDMRATAEAQGPRALRNFERANNLNRQVEERIQGALASLLGRDNLMHPERAGAAINQLIRSGRGSANIARLDEIRRSTVKGGEWDDISGAIMRQMGQPAQSEGRAFDPGTFVRNFADMTPEARNLLFGSARNGRGETNALRESLDNFVAVNQRLADSNALRNTSNTVPAGIGAAAVGSAGTAVATGFINPLLAIKLAAGGAASAYAVNRLSRVWTDPGFVRWATGYTRMLQRAAQQGAEPGADAVSRQRRYLERVARASPGIAIAIDEISQQLWPSQ